ncbi:hypothetical protein [Rhodopila globiformis]|uniref:Uncharacterized protein n=1 Tax=Rhodopila globiformis TaxID=1071 RepID=A0A2S6N2M2_RHOGL|nr:hypothetical protein [Rhodopila globiformis]PPQ28848.1 hypothetical protein CCS01_22970 [Rhodopila globiformis]
MKDDQETVSIKRQQRRMQLVGFIVAAIPIGCQLLMLMALRTAPDGAFPVADRTFTDARFWPIQIVLLCVGVAGSAIKLMWNTGRAQRTALVYLLTLILVFFIESLMFSVTLLAATIGWKWLGAMTVIGLLNLGLAYALEMELAVKN